MVCSCATVLGRLNEQNGKEAIWSLPLLMHERQCALTPSRRYSLQNKLGNRMIKQFLNSVIAKYRDLPVSRRSIICLSRWSVTWHYFAQPHSIIVNKLFRANSKPTWQEWFKDGMWRNNLRAIITHRHANFTVVMVTLMDCFLVTANIFADFNIIDGKIFGSRKIALRS